VIAAAGDIACDPDDADFNGGLGVAGHCHMKATAALVQGIRPKTVLELGDAQYNSGSSSDFLASYDKSWGVLKTLTRPVVGNHEYGTSGAAGYFGYFKTAATGGSSCLSNCPGYYSFNLGSWHIVAINTECTRINNGVGCAVGSPQEKWLKADLAQYPTKCTLVFGHRPRWSSNSFASSDIAPLVNAMVAAGVDLYLAGHSHSYERFAPMSASGAASSTGMTEIVVGTGGSFYSGFGTTAANSVVRKSNIFGVLKTTLRPTSYTWSFVPDSSTPFSDSGSRNCN
jgi:3',5'-cyclic AMP phosphodiesterase CpdA